MGSIRKLAVLSAVAAAIVAIYMPEGLGDVSGFPSLFAELIRRGWNDADLEKIAGGNVLRALQQAEACARELQSEN